MTRRQTASSGFADSTDRRAGWGRQVSSPGLDGLCKSRGTTRGKCSAGSRVGEAPDRELHIASVQGMKEKLKRQIILRTLESSWTPCLGNSKSSCMRASSFLWMPGLGSRAAPALLCWATPQRHLPTLDCFALSSPLVVTRT